MEKAYHVLLTKLSDKSVHSVGFLNLICPANSPNSCPTSNIVSVKYIRTEIFQDTEYEL